MGFDLVNSPQHYVRGRAYEPIDILQEYYPKEPLLWQAVKYLSRAGRKGPVRLDLGKSAYYVRKRMELLDRGTGISRVNVSTPVDTILTDWYGSISCDHNPVFWVCGMLLWLATDTEGTQDEAKVLLESCAQVLEATISELPPEGAAESGYSFGEFDREAQQTIIFPEAARLYYPALGLCGEAGEVAEKVKKLFRDHEGVLTDEYKSAIVKEVGDVLWYISALCRDLGVPMELAARECIKKLKSRQERGTLKGNGDER